MSRGRLTHSDSSRRGFSLIEMVVGLAVVSVLLVGMTSAIVLASRSLPSNDGPAAATVETARALHQLRDDLRAAVEIPVFSETSVTLHLPDRDGDGHPEVVTYAWAGTPGSFSVAANPAPLTRTENGNAAVALIDQVQDFTLDYVGGTRDAVFPGPVSVGTEVLLSYAEDLGSADDEWKVGKDDDIGFRFTPTPPSGAESLRVTRVLFKASKSGNDNGTLGVRLEGWNTANDPDGNTREEVEIDESTMDGNLSWREFAFANDHAYLPNETISVTARDNGNGNAAEVLYRNDAAPGNMHYWDESEGDWQHQVADGQVDHYAYGQWTATGDDWTLTTQHLTEVDITVVHATNLTTTHQLRVRLPNAPQAESQLWLADFNADPTTLDGDHDGAADWQADGGFDSADLDAGRWEATDNLRSAPDAAALDQPFTVDLWAQDTTNNGDGGGFNVRFDRDGSLQAQVSVEIDLIASGQMVRVLSKDTSGVGLTWHFQTQPAGEKVHVALAVDPDNDAVGLTIDGEVVGSFNYERFNGSSQDTLKPFVDGNTSGVFIDHLRLAQGGTVAVTPGAYTANSSSSGSSGTSGSGGSSETTTSSVTGDEDDDDDSSSSGGNWWDNLFSGWGN